MKIRVFTIVFFVALVGIPTAFGQPHPITKKEFEEEVTSPRQKEAIQDAKAKKPEIDAALNDPSTDPEEMGIKTFVEEFQSMTPEERDKLVDEKWALDRGNSYDHALEQHAKDAKEIYGITFNPFTFQFEGSGFPFTGEFLQCLDLRFEPACYCMTICPGASGDIVRTSPYRKYRWPVSKVETGLRMPFYGRYHVEGETAEQMREILRFYKSDEIFSWVASTVEASLEGANNALEALGKDPLKAPKVSKEKIKQVMNAGVPNFRTLIAKLRGDERLIHDTFLFRGQDRPGVPGRQNEYHALIEPYREIARHLANTFSMLIILMSGEIPPPGELDPLFCHDALPGNPISAFIFKWYSEFWTNMLNPLMGSPYLISRFPEASAFGPFALKYATFRDNPLICSALNIITPGGSEKRLTPQDLHPRDGLKGSLDVLDQLNPCMAWNHGPYVPFLAWAYSAYDPVASAVGFYKGIVLASTANSRYFPPFNREKDKVEWIRSDMPKGCNDLERNYLPVPDGGVYGAAMQDSKRPKGNIGVHWKEYRCCSLKDPGFPCLFFENLGVCDAS